MNNKEKYWLMKSGTGGQHYPTIWEHGPGSEGGYGASGPTGTKGTAGPTGITNSSGPNGDGPVSIPSAPVTKPVAKPVANPVATVASPPPVVDNPAGGALGALTQAPVPEQLSARDQWLRNRANSAGGDAIHGYNKTYGEGAWGRMAPDAQNKKLEGLLGPELFPHYRAGG